MKRNISKSIVFMLCIIIILVTVGCSSDVKTNYYRESPEVVRADTGLTWPEGQAMPSTAPLASEIDRVGINGLTNDQLTTLVTLQGLVNREKPRILLNVDDNIKKWQTEENNDHTYVDYKGKDDVWDLYKKYQDYFKGFIVYDTKSFIINGERVANTTANLANTVAGLKDCLPVTEKTMGKFIENGIDVPIVDDFRGKFNSNVEVYNYLYDNYWKDCSRRLLVSVSPTAHPHQIRDMGVAAKSAIIWLDPRIQEEADVIKKFLADLTPGKSIITGWWTDEGAGIKIGTNYGISTVPADFYRNSTIHAGTDRNLDPPGIPDKPVLENKIYVAATMTDGDNLQYNQGTMRMRWDNRQRGDVVLNWTISPALADAGPDLLNYYYKTATDADCLVSGPSGIGYASVENLPESAISTYAAWSDQYLAKTNINVVTLWSHMDSNFGKGYGIFTNETRSLYGLTIQSYDGHTQYKHYKNNIPVYSQVPWYSSGADDMFNTISGRVRQKQWNGSTPLFFASHAVSWDVGVPEMIYLEKKLKAEFGEENVVFVRLDHMSMLINEYENLPYNLSLNSTTSITTSDDSVDGKLAADGTYNTMWTSSKEGDKWLTFDLGEEYNVSRYILQNAGMDQLDKSLNTKEFEVLVSTDGEKWTSVDKVKDSADNYRDVDLEEPHRARYVKFEITNPGEDGTARIGEIEIFGNKPTQE